MDGAQIHDDVLFIAFLEFGRSSGTFHLYKVSTRPTIFVYVVDAAFVYTFQSEMPETIKLSLGLILLMSHFKQNTFYDAEIAQKCD